MPEQSHQPCPYPICGSSDAFSYNTERKVGQCHSCGTPYPSRLKMYDWAKEKYPTKSNWNKFTEVIEEDMKKEYRDHRGITEKTMRFYDVETEIDENNKEIRHGYKYPDGKTKYRIFPKQFVADPGLKTDVFWGMNRFNGGSAKAVTICEGELDAMSAFQMLGSKYPAVSLPSATPKRTILENCYEWLSSFEKIYLSLDTDDKAENFAIALMNLFPGRVYKVNHDKYKDANEFLQAGAATSYQNAWFNARLYTPSTILANPEDFMELYEDTPNHQYVSTGIPDLDAKILGLMQGHFTVILAETGIGKTEFMRYLQYNILKNNPDVKIAAWHLEESPLRSILGLASYELKDNVTRKDIIEDKGVGDKVKGAIKTLTDSGRYIQFSLKESDSIEALVDQIRILKEAYGCQYIFFEPIQDVLSISDEKEKESKLASLAIQLSKMAAKLNVGIVTIAHTNENGDVKYCKMVAQRASVRIVLSRDKEASNPIERNTTYLKVTKNRPCGLEGDAGALTFDLATFTLKPKEEGF